MAKGDHKRAEDMIGRQERQQNTEYGKMSDALYNANTGFQNTYNQSRMQIPDYRNIMSMYENFYNNPWGSPSGGYQNIGNGMFKGQDPSVMTYKTSGSGGGGGGQYGYTPKSQAQDPAYVEQQLRSNWANTRGGEIPRDELDKMMKYILTPDTYTGGQVRAGWSPYWQERFFVPGHEGASGADQGGDDTLLGYDNSFGGGGRDIRSMFQGAAGIPGWGGWGEGDWGNYGNSALGSAQGFFQGMMNDGGYSAQDMADMRARAMGPIRSMFSSAKAGLDQNRNLQGGYSPNYAASLAKMNREMGYNMADAQTNVNASIAADRAHNRLAAGQGMSNLGQFGAGLHADIDKYGAGLGFNYDQLASQDALARDTAGMQARMNALGGMSGLYGTTPGMMNMAGNQLLGSGQNLISGYNSLLAGNQGLMNGIMGMSQIPGNFQSVMGNIGSALNLAVPFINPFGSMFSRGGGTGGYNPVYGATGMSPADMAARRYY